MNRSFPVLLLVSLFSFPGLAISDAAMQQSLHAFFSEGVFVGGARAELVEVLRWPEAQGALRWRLPRISGHPSRISLIAEQGDRGKTRRWYVPVRVRWWAQAVVARRDLPVRTLITESMLTTKMADVSEHVGTWWKEVGDLVGTRLLRPLRAGDVIFSTYVKQPKLLKRGDRVLIVACTKGLKVSAVGTALRSAGLGERVPVRNVGSRKVIEAIVMDAGTVGTMASWRNRCMPRGS